VTMTHDIWVANVMAGLGLGIAVAPLSVSKNEFRQISNQLVSGTRA